MPGDLGEEGGQPAAPHAASDVFVSYASQDAAVANKLVETLERDGIRCWIAPRDVKAGAQYADAIIRALTNARAMVLVLSAHSIASSHVGKEIERASSKKRPIIALKTDSAPLTPALEYFLSESQWIEVKDGKTEAAYAKLIDAIRDPAQAAPPGTAAPPTPAAPPNSRRNRLLLAAGLAVVAVTLVALYAPRFWLPGHSAAEHPSTVASIATTAISDKSIAVLPFVDMSEKHDQEYFADGMAEEILDLLAKIPGLTVIGRTSSFSFKGKNEDLRTIGTRLNAAHVLEGSVRKSGGQVRITAQLINTKTGVHEWSETYDRPIGDVFKLQDAIAAVIVREMQLTVASAALTPRVTPTSADTYDLMLRGRHAYDRADNAGADEAATLFQQALDQDPKSAEAAAWLANAYSSQAMGASVSPAIAFEQARHAATVALQLDPKNPIAHVALADIHMIYDWDWAAAERELKQVATVAPQNVAMLMEQAWLSLTLGRSDEALKQIQTALARDPMNPGVLQDLGTIQQSRGHLPEAEAAMRRALEIRPNYGYGNFILALILLARGDRAGALLEMQQETSDDGKRQGLAIVYYALGRKSDSDAALAGMLKKDAELNAFGIAEVYGFRGQIDEAMHWLERAYAQKDAYLYIIKRDELLQKLRTDPRFKAFLRKMNLPE